MQQILRLSSAVARRAAAGGASASGRRTAVAVAAAQGTARYASSNRGAGDGRPPQRQQQNPQYGGSERKEYAGERREAGGSERKEYSGERREAGGSERKEYSGERREYSKEPGSGGERRQSGGGERRQYGGERRQYGGGERQQYGGGERQQYGGGERRQYGGGERKQYGGEPRQYAGERKEAGSSERKEYGGERRQYGGGERKEYNKEAVSGERKEYGGERKQFGGTERKEYGSERRQYGGERREYNKESGGSERQQYGGERRQYGGERRQYGGERKEYGSERRAPPQQQQLRRRPPPPSTDQQQQQEWRASGSAATAAAASAAAPAAPTGGLSAAVAAEVSSFGVTMPPRRAGVTDGSWDRNDELAVAEAVADAEKLERQYAKYSGGDVILGRSQEELVALLATVGQPAYRAKQLRDGVMQGARSVLDITTLSKTLRAELAEKGVRSGRSVIHHTVNAADGTRKFLLQLVDGLVVETVGIPVDDAERKRLTVCVSSQVGCPMRCTFCATGKGGFARNLLPHEIVDQVLTVQEEFGQRVSNVVFMGMGEPLLNLPSVLRAHEILNKDVGIGARHITISTVGVPNAIQRMGRLQLQSTLAVSIHAPSQALRETIVPSAKAYPLDALMADCLAYFRLSGRRVTFEYTLLAGVNDQLRHAEELAALLRRHDLRSHVNLIPWNPVDESEFKRPTRRTVEQFAAVLEDAGVPVSLRNTRGLEAAAACGQLRNQFQKQPLEEFTVPQ